MDLTEDLIRDLLHAAPDPTIITNEDGQIAFVNHQVRRVFGYEPHELVGEPIEVLLPERYLSVHPRHRQSFFVDPQPRGMGVGLELFGRRKNGAEFPVEISLSPVRSDHGMLAVSAIRDITDQKLTQDALHAATETAKQANATKSRFLAAASHDLRQPLQSLGLYLSVLERITNGEKEQEVEQKMRKSLDVMGELLDALLDISKLDAGSITPEKQDFPLQKLFDQLDAANSEFAAEKGLILHFEPSKATLHTDRILLQRILENFVANAIRYTEAGDIEVTCTNRDDVARIEVRDTGVGVPEEALETIFEEYFQLDNPVRDRRKGLGLGLSIVKLVASLLDHPLDVVSTVGEGSVFAITVPLGQSQPVPMEVPGPGHTAERSISLNVLFVDDDPAIIDAMGMLLEVAGMNVVFALNGEDALAQIDESVFDVVVSDYRLPGMNGVEVIERVRHAISPDLPAILMTGDTTVGEIEKERLERCTVLHKPVDPDRLISLLESATSGR